MAEGMINALELKGLIREAKKYLEKLEQRAKKLDGSKEAEDAIIALLRADVGVMGSVIKDMKKLLEGERIS